MEAKELRIGNLIESVATKPSELVIVDSYVLKCIEKNATWYRPILLTEEWLIKFGFKNNYRQYEWDNWGMWVEKGLGDYYIVSHGFANAKSELKSIKYVHQLQNLYFALTGEELELK